MGPFRVYGTLKVTRSQHVQRSCINLEVYFARSHMTAYQTTRSKQEEISRGPTHGIITAVCLYSRNPSWWYIGHAETCSRLTNVWYLYILVHVKLVIWIMILIYLLTAIGLSPGGSSTVSTVQYITVQYSTVQYSTVQYSTHLHTNSTQNDTKQTIHRTTQQFGRVQTVPRLG